MEPAAPCAVVSSDLTFGFLYVVAHAGWVWAFRSGIDPRCRAVAGKRLGGRVVWGPATTFPVEVWSWTLAGPRRSGDGRLSAYCAALCLAGAFSPVVALVLALRVVGCSTRLLDTLYLMTMPMMLLFVRLVTRRRGELDEDVERLGGYPAHSPKLREQQNQQNQGVIRPKERGVP